MGDIIEIADLLHTEEPYDQVYKEAAAKIKYAAYHVICQTQTGQKVKRTFIVLMNTDGLILCFTGLEQYIGIPSYYSTQAVTRNDEGACKAVCRFLNVTLLKHYETYRKKRIEDLTWDCVEDYMNTYAFTPFQQTGRCPTPETVRLHQLSICSFLDALKKEQKLPLMRDIDFFRERNSLLKNINRKVRIANLNTYTAEEMRPQRLNDMPLSIFERLINIAKIYDPMLCLAMGIQAWAGLRASEVCNLFGSDSVLGIGIQIKKEIETGRYLAVTLCLDLEQVLRGDAVDVGNIKRERNAQIHPVYLDDFKLLYEQHLELLKNYTREDTKPLFVNRQINHHTGYHMAMTYYSYLARFKALLPLLQKELSQSGSQEDQSYADLMLYRRLTPHVFRHLFSVQLVLMGVDEVALQSWRGDKNPDSARTYLRNKRVLMEQYDRYASVAMKYAKNQAEANCYAQSEQRNV